MEPFLPHDQHTEYYVCINSGREGDSILFTHEGGIDVGDVDAKALKLDISVGSEFPSRQAIKATLLKHVPEAKKDTLVNFLVRLYAVYVDLHFAYLEINPLICLDGANGKPPTIHYLDMAAKLDQVNQSSLFFANVGTIVLPTKALGVRRPTLFAVPNGQLREISAYTKPVPFLRPPKPSRLTVGLPWSGLLLSVGN